MLKKYILLLFLTLMPQLHAISKDINFYKCFRDIELILKSMTKPESSNQLYLSLESSRIDIKNINECIPALEQILTYHQEILMVLNRYPPIYSAKKLQVTL